ncbi:MAG: hypothetical protein HY270_17435 [Deltaproteobacteria bacterium]|nr:hypothetical protein [Deltaproteobacteria bacterium]
MTDKSATGLSAGDTTAFIDLIRAQGDSEAQQVVVEAEHAAQRLHSQAESDAKAIADAAAREGEERGRRRHAKMLAETEARLHREHLWERERLLQTTLQSAQQRLLDFCRLPGAAAMFEQLIREALEQMPDGRVVLCMPQEYLRFLDAARLATLGGGRWDIRISTHEPPPSGGVIASSADGRLRYDNSFGERLRRVEDAARVAAHAALFGDWRE